MVKNALPQANLLLQNSQLNKAPFLWEYLQTLKYLAFLEALIPAPVKNNPLLIKIGSN